MKLTDLIQKNKLEQIAFLHGATKGWDKYLVMELLNNYFDEIQDILHSKYSTYQQEIQEGVIYANEYYFHYYEFVNNELYIHKLNIFFDVPTAEILNCCKLYDAIEILENTLTDSLSDEDLQKLHPSKEKALKTSKKKIYEYCQVGVLFAQGFIKKKGSIYYYKNQSFKSSLALAKHLKENNKVTSASVRQNIDETFKNVKQNKNSLYHPTRAENILEDCQRKGITPVQEFYDKMKEFESL